MSTTSIRRHSSRSLCAGLAISGVLLVTNPCSAAQRSPLGSQPAFKSVVNVDGVIDTGAPGTDQQPPTAVEVQWASDKAVHLIGLPEVKSKLRGTLQLSPIDFSFITPGGETTIERAHMLSLSIGDERMERGGKMAKIARSAIPYGGGAAVAAMSGTQVDLLTIEFRDAHNAYHGAVFSLPKDEALIAQKQFLLVPRVQPLAQSQPACFSGLVRPSTLKVADVAVGGQPLPPEYKVMLYEHLMRRLHDQAGLAGIYRDGDTSEAAACPELTLTITVNAFTKGNAVLRASTGPLGFFLGTTLLSFRMELRDYSGNVLLDQDVKRTQRGDNESLDIVDELAKSVTKKLKKAKGHMAS